MPLEFVKISEDTGEVERITSVDSDGWEYDVETGEVLGLAEPRPAFTVDSIEAADWVLERRSEIDAAIAAVDLRIKALTANLQSQRASLLRRLSYLDFRFSPSLTAFARKELEGRKERTLQLTYGKVAFRKTPGSTVIIDMPAAVRFVREWNPNAVKVVETVALKSVLDANDSAYEATGDYQDTPFMLRSTPGETVSIETGVKPKEKG